MNFFQTLFQMMTTGVDYNLTVSRSEDAMTVIVMPKVNGLKDPGAVHIVPFTMCAAPHELDNAFFGHLSQPLQKSSAVLCNMSQFEKQTEQAAANSKSAKTQKEQESKEAKSKKEKYDKFMKAADEHEIAGKLQEAMTNLQQARLHGTEKEVKKVDEKITELKMKMSQGSLFEMEPKAAAPVEQQPAQQQQQPAPTPAPVEPAPPVQQPMPGMPPQGYYGQPPQGQYAGQHGQTGGQNYGQPYPGGYPQGGNMQGHPYPQNNPYGYQQQGHYQQPPQNPGFPVNEGCYRPEDYAGMPDLEATHVGQAIGM